MNRILAIVIDLVLVVVFAAIGRASHAEALDPAGLARTALPFLAGTLLAWITLMMRRAPGTTLGGGVFVWAITLIGGMVFRVLIGDTIAVAFVIVAAISLSVLLLGWRAVLWLIERRRTPAESKS